MSFVLAFLNQDAAFHDGEPDYHLLVRTQFNLLTCFFEANTLL